MKSSGNPCTIINFVFDFTNNDGTLLRIYITSLLEKENINIPLLKNYVTALLNLSNIETFQYIKSGFKKQPKFIDKNIKKIIKIEYEISELEQMKVISNLFDIDEFEKFENKFLNLNLSCLNIRYDVVSKTFHIHKFPFPYKFVINILAHDDIYKSHPTMSNNLFNEDQKFEYKKTFKLLLYIAYKQNNLNNLQNELEKYLFEF